MADTAVRILFVLAAVWLTACGRLDTSAGSSSTRDIDVTGVWEVVRVDDVEVVPGETTRYVPILKIEGTSIGGQFGCNQGDGTVAVSGSRIFGEAESFLRQTALCTSGNESIEMVLSERALMDLLQDELGFDASVAEDSMVWSNERHNVEFERRN